MALPLYTDSRFIKHHATVPNATANIDRSNVRELPNINSPIVTKLTEGVEYTIGWIPEETVSIGGYEWYLISIDQLVGWIRYDVITITPIEIIPENSEFEAKRKLTVEFSRMGLYHLDQSWDYVYKILDMWHIHSDDIEIAPIESKNDG